jgi:L-ribulose-5-phosphate 3-epimerase
MSKSQKASSGWPGLVILGKLKGVDVKVMPRSIAINSYSYIWTHSAEQVLQHMASLGYRRTELMVTPPHLWPTMPGGARQRIAQLLRAEGLEIISLNPPMLDLNLASPASEVRDYSLEHYCSVVDMASEWHVPYVVVVPGKAHPLLPAPQHHRDAWLAEALGPLAERASRCGVQLLIENVPTSFLRSAGSIADLLDRLGDDTVGAVYDVANAVFIGEDPVEGMKLLGDRTRLVHLSDTALDRWQHHKLGTGAVSLEVVARALDGVGYSAPVVLEIISAEPDSDIIASHECAARSGIVTERATLSA